MPDTYIYTTIIIKDTSNEKNIFKRTFTDLLIDDNPTYGYPWDNAIKDLINYDMLKPYNQTFIFPKAGTVKPIEQTSPYTI